MLIQGQIVRSIAGHDKHRYYVVVESQLEEVLLVDGKQRKLESPKRKNIKHLAPTQCIVALEDYPTNRSLRRMLEPMNQKLKQRTTKEGGN